MDILKKFNDLSLPMVTEVFAGGPKVGDVCCGIVGLGAVRPLLAAPCKTKEEEPDYEPEETPTPPPKRPREDPVADDDDAKRPKVTEEPADGAMAPGVENNNNNDNDDDDVSLPLERCASTTS